MSAKHEARGTPVQSPDKADRASRGRDTQKGAHEDDKEQPANNPPNHGLPTHGVGRFLLKACDADTPLDELGDRYREWRGGDQATLEGFTDA